LTFTFVDSYRPFWVRVGMCSHGRSPTGEGIKNTMDEDPRVEDEKKASGAARSTVDLTARAPRLLRYSTGFIYFYFGFLKFYTDLSPAELLATQTIMRMWPWHVEADVVLVWIAAAETLIGLAFLFNVGLRYVFWLFLLHQLGTFMPFVLYPELTFKFAPFAPTMEGQYILKNLISLAAGLTVMLPAIRAGRERDRLARERAAAHALETSPHRATHTPTATDRIPEVNRR